MKVGETRIMKLMFFSNACWPKLLAPHYFLMSKISIKYSYSNFLFFFLQQVDLGAWNCPAMTCCFHRIINMRNTKIKFPYHLSQGVKPNHIFWCAKQDCWASQNFTVTVKELKHWKPQFPPIISNQPKMSQICLEEEMCLYRHNADSPRITAV